MDDIKNRKRIPTPLSPEEVKEKILGILDKRGEAGIELPKGASFPSLRLSKEERQEARDNPEFTHLEMTGVFSYADEIGIDGNDKEHILPGGMGFTFNWAAKGIGFGEFRMKVLTNGQLEVDTETMGKDFFKKVLAAMVDKAKDSSEKVH